MEIESTFKWDRFKDVRSGECFMTTDDDDVFVKIYAPSLGFGCAIDVNSGALIRFSPTARVEICDAKVIISKKKVDSDEG